jgi:hypothetical protein
MNRILLLTYGRPRAPVAPSGAVKGAVGGLTFSTDPRVVAEINAVSLKRRLEQADERQAKSGVAEPKSTIAKGTQSPIFARVGRPSLAMPASYDVDELLSRCPSQQTMEAIRRDFNISFDSRLVAPWSCSGDGTESSVMLTVYNAFRAMRLIEFDAPIPLLNSRNLYDWLYGLNLANIKFTLGESYSFADRGVINLRGEVLDSPDYRQWVSPRSAIGLMNIVLLIVHEARHANASGSPHANPDGTIGHPCSTDPAIEDVSDPTIDFGGAWAAQYWTSRWLAEHSGHYLTPREKAFAAAAAEQVRTSRFCDGGIVR